MKGFSQAAARRLFSTGQGFSQRVSFSSSHARRLFSSSQPYSFQETASPVIERYSRSLSLLHWLIGGSIVTCVATVKMAQWSNDKPWKARLMNVHKSLAIVVVTLLPLRFGARYFSRIPAHLPGTKIEQLAGSLSHYALYGFMTVMPLSGIAMGYFR
jgi:cytochrome b561